ncbi:MAG: hypothetical protein K2L38_06270 [Dysosmobacter sp.]|nr:hypothetical protein [Dysosmobacter sp.]
MMIDIYKDELQNVWLFGQSVLYTDQPIQREEVPDGWHCYDLKGTGANPKRPYELTVQADQNFAGSILSAVPLMRGRTQSKLVQDNFWLTAIPVTLADFCVEEGIPYPQPPEELAQAAEGPAEAWEPAARG